MYADPMRCPDCREPLVVGASSCPSCGLEVHGPLAQQLFATLTRADELLAALRAAGAAKVVAVEADAAAGAAATGPAPQSAALPPPLPSVPAGPKASPVPKILLTLGAACLLVAALVFIAVTWSVLGVGGRTIALVTFTAIAGGLTAFVAHRDLRAGTEALGLVTLGLAALDVFGARNAGWLGEPSDSGFLLVLGAFLTVAGAGSAGMLRRSPAAGFTSGEVVAGFGTALAVLGAATGDWADFSLRMLLALLGVAAVALGAQRLLLPVAAFSTGTVAALTWATLALDSIARAAEHSTWRELWVDFEAWPLLAAAAIAAAPALVRRLPAAVRVLGLGIGLLLFGLALAMPSLDGTATSAVLTALVAWAVATGYTWVTPKPWRLSGLLPLGVAGLVVLVATANLGGRAVARAFEAAGATWTGTTGGQLPEPSVGDQPDAWLLPLCALAAVGTVALGSRLLDRAVPGRTALVGSFVVAGGALAGTLLLYPVPVWTVLAALLLLAGALIGFGLARADGLATVAGPVFLFAAVVLSWYDERLTLVAMLTAVVLLALLNLADRRPLVADLAGCGLSLAAAGSAWTAGAVAEVRPEWAGLIALGTLAVLALGRVYLPGPASLGVEVGAAAAVAPVVMAGVIGAPADLHATWLAVYLTVAGAVVTVMSLLRADRRLLAWPGGLLLAAATWVRLWDIGVNDPEPYTLPSAVALICAGLVFLRRDPQRGTFTALGPGLALALVPSLLWVLAEPATLRSLLLGLACLALVLAGARLGWAAPLVTAAVVGLVVVLRHAAPYIGETVPRWAIIGAAGALLVGLGVTWESRLKEASNALGYLRRLR